MSIFSEFRTNFASAILKWTKFQTSNFVYIDKKNGRVYVRQHPVDIELPSNNCTSKLLLLSIFFLLLWSMRDQWCVCSGDNGVNFSTFILTLFEPDFRNKWSGFENLLLYYSRFASYHTSNRLLRCSPNHFALVLIFISLPLFLLVLCILWLYLFPHTHAVFIHCRFIWILKVYEIDLCMFVWMYASSNLFKNKNSAFWTKTTWFPFFIFKYDPLSILPACSMIHFKQKRKEKKKPKRIERTMETNALMLVFISVCILCANEKRTEFSVQLAGMAGTTTSSMFMCLKCFDCVSMCFFNSKICWFINRLRAHMFHLETWNIDAKWN